MGGDHPARERGGKRAEPLNPLGCRDALACSEMRHITNGNHELVEHRSVWGEREPVNRPEEPKLPLVELTRSTKLRNQDPQPTPGLSLMRARQRHPQHRGRQIRVVRRRAFAGQPVKRTLDQTNHRIARVLLHWQLFEVARDLMKHAGIAGPTLC